MKRQNENDRYDRKRSSAARAMTIERRKARAAKYGNGRAGR